MTPANSIIPSTFHISTLGKRMIIGAIIGFCILAFFVFINTHTKPEWGAYWKIRPLLIGPFAGAMGGLFFHLLNPFRRGGWKTIVANIFGVIIFIIGMWMGIILGLSGTLWN